jgi:purine nucleosidase
MGGSYFNAGNVTPYAEFNVWADAEAAQQVFAAEWNEIIAVGLDVTHQTAITHKMWKEIPQGAGGSAWLLKQIVERTYTERVRSGFFLHDPLAMAVALDPSLVTLENHAVNVELDGEQRGRTEIREGGNVRVATGVDSKRFMQSFCRAVNIPYIEDEHGLQDSE